MATPAEIKEQIDLQVRKKNTTFQAKPERTLADILDDIVDQATAAEPGYKVYTAILTQPLEGGEPTVTVLKNTIGDIAWQWSDDGVLMAGSDGLFPNLKTWLSATQGNGGGNSQGVLWFFRGTQDQLFIQQWNLAGAALVNGFSDVSVEVRVYP